MARTKTISDAELLAVARQVFSEKGFAAPAKMIARRAGISEGVLFQRFATKRDLFFAAMLLPAADLTRLFEEQRPKGVEHLHAIALATTDYFRSAIPVLVPLMASPGFRFEEFAARHPDSPLDQLRKDLVSFFLEERRAGRIGAGDPGAAALTIVALAQSIAFFEHMGAHDGRFPPEILRRAVDCLWNGLSSSPSKRRNCRPELQRH